MKKLMMIAAALAMALSFLPKAEASETAELGLTVTFKLEPLKLWAEPEGPFSVSEGEELKFNVIAEDLDAKEVFLLAGALPEGATFNVITNWQPPTNRVTGVFTWTPAVGQAQDAPYEVEFKATSSNQDTGLGMIVKILVRQQPVISIELEPTTWVLEGVKLGEKRHNLNMIGEPIHVIRNTGNVPIMAAIHYMPLKVMGGIHPGLEQGLDTFITGLYKGTFDNDPSILPPDGGLKIGAIEPGDKMPLHLLYGAPTKLSEGIQGHGVTYELRAYKALPDPGYILQ